MTALLVVVVAAVVVAAVVVAAVVEVTNMHDIVMIDSITNSYCLCYYVRNGLSYSGEETRPKL